MSKVVASIFFSPALHRKLSSITALGRHSRKQITNIVKFCFYISSCLHRGHESQHRFPHVDKNGIWRTSVVAICTKSISRFCFISYCELLSITELWVKAEQTLWFSVPFVTISLILWNKAFICSKSCTTTHPHRQYKVLHIYRYTI